MNPYKLAHEFMIAETGQEGGQVTIDWYAFRNALVRVLLDAYKRGGDDIPSPDHSRQSKG